MRVNLVVRVLDAEGQLLAWAPVQAEARGDGCLRAVLPVLVAEQAGTMSQLVVHWPDLHVVQRSLLTAVRINAGDTLTLTLDGGIAMHFHSDAGPLPAVTLRAPVAVGVPLGMVGARQ